MLIIKCVDFVEETFADVDAIALKKEWLGRVRGFEPATAIITLLDDPANPEANAIGGKYLCFIADRWQEGLTLMLASKDEELKKLVVMEQKGPAGTDQQRQLGDAWYAMAQSERTYEEGMMRRARHWYAKALTGLKGVSHDQLAEKIDDIDDELPVRWKDIPWDNMTEKVWNRLDGTVVTCNAKHLITDTGIKVAAGQRLRVVPHPNDQWSFTLGSGKLLTCTGKGDPSDAYDDPFVYVDSVASANRQHGNNGGLCASLQRADGPTCSIDLIEGPGILVLRPIMPYNTAAGRGAIRCKVLEYPPE